MASLLQPGEITVVLGAVWGDEGKGKLSDILCGEADICARCQVSEWMCRWNDTHTSLYVGW